MPDRPSTELDGLRSAADVLFARGGGPCDVVAALRVPRTTAWTWWRRWRATGTTDVRRRGPPPRLAPAARRALATALRGPAADAGIPGGVWSLAGLAWWIGRSFGVRYHPRHLGRLLRASGWTFPPLGRRRSTARFVLPVRDPHGGRIELWFAPR